MAAVVVTISIRNRHEPMMKFDGWVCWSFASMIHPILKILFQILIFLKLKENGFSWDFQIEAECRTVKKLNSKIDEIEWIDGEAGSCGEVVGWYCVDVLCFLSLLVFKKFVVQKK